MATNTITMQIHFNHHDPRQQRLVESFAQSLQNMLRGLDAAKLQLLQTQPDSATVALLTDMINKDCEAAANEVRIAFHNAKKDNESRFAALGVDLAWHWRCMMEEPRKFGNYILVYDPKSKTSTMKGISK